MSRPNSVSPIGTKQSPPPPYHNGHGMTNAYEMTSASTASLVTTVARSKGTAGENDAAARDGRSMDARQHIFADDSADLQLTFYEAMSPLFKFMQIMGLWHSEIINPPKATTKTRRILNARTYSVVVLVILWVNLLRFLPSFVVGAELDPKRLFFKVIYLTVLLQAALNASVNFWAASKKTMLRDYFVHLEATVQRDQENKLDLRWLRKKCKVYTGVAASYIVFHFLNQTVGVFSPIESIRNSTNIFVAPFAPNTFLHLVCIVFNIFDFASWIFPLLYFLLTCQFYSRLFQSFVDRFEAAVTRAAKEKRFPPNFEILRRQHQSLCESVDLGNRSLFTYINLITYLTMGPLACFMLYQLFFSPDIAGNISAYIMYTIWLSSIFVDVGVVSWYAAVMSSKAHDPREKCFSCVVESATNEQILQMNMFLSRLSGADIGFTIFDLVILTKPFILTIGGLVLTYYAIISEFQG